ncbi:MAG: hypothetical protein V3S11_02665, partial [Elusimicrobiota bacterium]
ALRSTFRKYKAMFRLARRLSAPLSRSRSAALREIGTAFGAVDEPGHPRGLTRIAGSLRRLQGSWTLLLDFFYMHSAKSLWFLNKRFQRDRARIAHLSGALAELDVHLALAQSALGWKDGYALPDILDRAAARLKIEQGHQPFLLKQGGSVPNDAELTLEMDRQTGVNFAVLTGVNAGGKSTYLSMLSLLTILAQIGAPVPAKSMELTPLHLMTSIVVNQNLAKGDSFFVAEGKRMLEIIQAAKSRKDLLAIFDEILLGTNPEERMALEHSLIPYLARTANLFMLSTHDLKMTKLEGRVPGVGNVHVDPDKPYTISPGPSRTRNAIDTVEKIGFPDEIVDDARRYLKDHPVENEDDAP